MSHEEEDDFEDRITKVVEQVISKRLQKLVVAVWLMIVGGSGSLIFLGVQWGTISTTVAANAKREAQHHADVGLHMAADRRFEVFVTRTEWAAILREKERDTDQLQADVSRINDKVDKLIEVLSGGRIVPPK